MFLIDEDSIAIKSGGVYQINSTRNNKIYIGSTRNFLQRYKEHKSMLANGTHHSPNLQAEARRDFNNLEFQVRVVLIDLSRENLLLWETLELSDVPRKLRLNSHSPMRLETIDGKYSVQSRIRIPSLDEIKRSIFGSEDD